MEEVLIERRICRYIDWNGDLRVLVVEGEKGLESFLNAKRYMVCLIKKKENFFPSTRMWPESRL